MIQDALERLGVYSPGEVLAAADASRGLQVLNDMIDNWQSENLPIYTLTTYTITTSNGVGAYTVGIGGTINSARPLGVDMGPGKATYTSGATATPVNIVSRVEWLNLESLASGTGSTGKSNTLFYDPQYPLGIFNVMPVPTSNTDTIGVPCWVPAGQIANLTSSSTYEQGAIEALKLNLSIRLKPYFLDSQMPPEIVVAANEAKNALKFTNITSRAMLRRHNPITDSPRAKGA